MSAFVARCFAMRGVAGGITTTAIAEKWRTCCLSQETGALGKSTSANLGGQAFPLALPCCARTVGDQTLSSRCESAFCTGDRCDLALNVSQIRFSRATSKHRLQELSNPQNLVSNNHP